MSKKEQLIKSKERVKKFAEVYTPEHIVKDMCNLVPDEMWNSDKTILEPACGNGNFLVEITRRKMEHCKQSGKHDYLVALNTIYGIDILPDNVMESKQRMLDIVLEYIDKSQLTEATKILDKRIICGDSLQIMKQWAEEEEPYKQQSLF